MPALPMIRAPFCTRVSRAMRDYQISTLMKAGWHKSRPMSCTWTDMHRSVAPATGHINEVGPSAPMRSPIREENR